MTSNLALRPQMIHQAMARHTGATADVALALWQPLATHLITLIGESGFSSLYARSLFLTRAAFPWLAPGSALHSAEIQFADLKTSLEAQGTLETKEASHLLLLTFTNILALLIGESLITGILNSAWGDDGANAAIAAKEHLNE